MYLNAALRTGLFMGLAGFAATLTGAHLAWAEPAAGAQTEAVPSEGALPELSMDQKIALIDRLLQDKPISRAEAQAITDSFFSISVILLELEARVEELPKDTALAQKEDFYWKQLGTLFPDLVEQQFLFRKIFDLGLKVLDDGSSETFRGFSPQTFTLSIYLSFYFKGRTGFKLGGDNVADFLNIPRRTVLRGLNEGVIVHLSSAVQKAESLARERTAAADQERLERISSVCGAAIERLRARAGGNEEAIKKSWLTISDVLLKRSLRRAAEVIGQYTESELQEIRTEFFKYAGELRTKMLETRKALGHR